MAVQGYTILQEWFKLIYDREFMINSSRVANGNFTTVKHFFIFFAVLLASVSSGALMAIDNRFLYLMLGGIAAIGYAILSYERPFAAFYVLIVLSLTVWLSTLRVVGDISPLIGLGLIFTGTWLLRLFVHRTALLKVKEYYLLLGLTIVLVISVIRNIDGPAGISPMFTYLQLFLLFLLVINHVSSPLQLYALSGAIVLSSTLLAIAILIGQIGLLPEGIIGQQAAGVYVGSSQEIVSRAGGLWGDANFTAMQLTIALPFIIARWFLTHSWLKRIVLLGAAGAIFGAISLTFSTGGMIGLAVILIGWIVRSSWRGRLPNIVITVLFFLIMLGLTSSFMPELYMQRVAMKLDVVLNAISIGDRNLLLTIGTDRGDTWQAAFRAIGDSPLWGNGPGNSAYRNTRYSVFYSGQESLAAHNMFLTFASELGLSGFIFFAGFLVSALRSVYQSSSLKNSSFTVSYSSTALFIALIAYIVQGLAIDIHSQKVLWVLLGMAITYREKNLSDKVLYATSK